LKNDATQGRVQATKILKDLRVTNDSALSSASNYSEKEALLIETKNGLLKVQNFLIKVSAVLDSAINLDNTSQASYKENVSTGRTNVNTAIQSLANLLDDISSQKITTEKIGRELELLKLGATEEVLTQQESAIMKAEASVKSAESSLRKTIIRSPINGKVTKQEAKVGELASAGINLVSVMNDQDFKIEANIPEVDVPKIKIGNKAEVTLDAYGSNTKFLAEINSIYPAEEVKDGVPTYKTTFSIINPSLIIKSGMTANITIKTVEKTNAIVIPLSAITKESDKNFVNKVVNNKIEKVEIETGITGSGGMIEIISGLSEGDKILKK
jgi:HlyD family secretion protein